MTLERMYERRFADVSQADRTAVWNDLGPWLYNFLDKPAKIIDLAAGRCEFINSVPASDRWAIDQMDISAYAKPGTRVIRADILKAELEPGSFDGVFMSNFLEHLPDAAAVQSILAAAKRALKPGGRIGIMGPNFKYCAREYFDCADHSLVLTDTSVAEHLYAAGFKLETIHPRFLPFSFRSRYPASPFLTRLYLQMPAAWRLLGKQFLIRASVAK